MTARRGWLALLALLALPWMTPAAGASPGCLLKVGWTPYSIYTFANDRGEVKGIDADLIATAAHAAGCRVEFRQSPWARILVEIREGTLDATSSASWTAERNTFAMFSVPYREAEVAIFVRGGEARKYPLTSLSDIPTTRFRLGTVTGYHYGDEFQVLMKDPRFAAQVDSAANYEVNINKLLHDRIDGVIVDDVGVMLGEARKLGVSDRIERLPLRIASEQLHFMFSRKSVDPAVVAAIDAALAKMRQEGRLQAIVDRYQR